MRQLTGFTAAARDPASDTLSGPLPETVAAGGMCNGVGTDVLDGEGWVASTLRVFTGASAHPGTTLAVCLSQFASTAGADAAFGHLGDTVVPQAPSTVAGQTSFDISAVPDAIGVATRGAFARVAFDEGRFVALVTASRRSGSATEDLADSARQLATAQYQALTTAGS